MLPSELVNNVTVRITYGPRFVTRHSFRSDKILLTLHITANLSASIIHIKTVSITPVDIGRLIRPTNLTKITRENDN